MSESFSFPVAKDLPAQNPLLAKATVTNRASQGSTASARPHQGDSREDTQKGAMPPPPLPKRPGKIPLEKGYSQMDWMRLQRTSKDLAGLKGQPLRRNITMEEVKQHSSKDDAWTVLRGRVYNITPYMNFHPGGVAQLRRGAGIDSTVLFNKYHAWVNAEMMMEKCLVGLLAREEVPQENGPS